MRLGWKLLFVAIDVFCLGSTAVAHPSSGIAVTESGEVLFVHSTRGVAKVDSAGKLTYVHTRKRDGVRASGKWMGRET